MRWTEEDINAVVESPEFEELLDEAYQATKTGPRHELFVFRRLVQDLTSEHCPVNRPALARLIARRMLNGI